ncbi:MAG: phosphodiester glycosidase family protein [Candidatus Izemoplasmatales bacterium]
MTFRLLAVFYTVLFLFSSFVLLYQFVIPHGGFYVDDPVITTTTTSTTTSETTSSTDGSGTTVPTTTTTTTASVLSYPGETPSLLTPASLIGSFESEYSLVNVYKIRLYSSDVFVADVVVRDAYQVLTALAYNNFGGTNYVQTVSTMAEDHDAVFAVNADYATHYETGFVIRNGMVLRSTISYRYDVVLYEDGSVDIFKETASSNVNTVLNAAAWQLWSFGPPLIIDDVSVADVNDGLDRDKVNNPRTAFGYLDNYHYLFVVVDGRTTISSGVDIEELADIMASLGCTQAYNWDGGGSATMYFDGKVINTPSQGSEREVSDCVYIKRY